MIFLSKTSFHVSIPPIERGATEIRFHFLIIIQHLFFSMTSDVEGNIFDPRGRPQSRPVVIIILEHVSVRTSVPTFQNITKQNKRRVKIMMGLVGLWVWPSGSLMTHL